MKLLKLSISVLLFTSVLTGQTVYDNFNEAARDSIVGRAGYAWSTSHDNYWIAGSAYKINSDSTISPYDPRGSGRRPSNYLDTVFSTANGLTVKLVVKQKGLALDWQPLYIYMGDDSVYSGMDGYLWKFNLTGDATAYDVCEIKSMTNGAEGSLTNVNREVVVGDTIEASWYADGRKSLKIRHQTGIIDSATTVVTSADQTTVYVVLRGVTAISQDNKFDDFYVYAHEAVAPPETDVVAPTVTSTVYPGGQWSTTTTGYVDVKGTDPVPGAIDSFNVYLRLQGAYWSDSLQVQCGDTQRDTTVRFSFGPLAAGTYEVVPYVKDSAGNSTTGSTKTIVVAEAGGGGGGEEGAYEQLWVTVSMDGLAQNPTSVRLDEGWRLARVWLPDIDFDGVDVAIWFHAREDWTASGWLAEYTEPPNSSAPALSAAGVDFDLEYARRQTGNSTYRFRKMMRDSLTAHGGKMLLDMGGVSSTGDNFDTIFEGDSATAQLFVDRSTTYARLREYDGVSVNWEHPNTKNGFTRCLRMYRKALDAWPVPGILHVWLSKGYVDYSSIYDADSISAFTDMISPMTYNYGGGSASNEITHHAPLYDDCNAARWSIDDHGQKAYLAAGFDTAKLTMTIAGEAVQYTNIPGVALCTPQGSASRTYSTYQQGLNAAASGAEYWAPEAEGPYSINGTGDALYSYDNPASITAKLNYGLSIGLKAIMIWDLQRGWLITPPTGHTHDEQLATAKSFRGGGGGAVTVLDPPTLLTPANGTDSLEIADLWVTWNTVTGATNYRIQVSLTSTFNMGDIVSTQANYDTSTYLVGAFDEGVTYYWRVATVNEAGTGPYSAPFSFTMLPPPLVAPSRVVLTYPANADTGIVFGGSGIVFTWVADTNALSYDFQLMSGGDTTVPQSVQSQTGIATNSWTFVSLLAYNTQYHWRVRATNTAGTGTWSYYWWFRTTREPIVQPPATDVTKFLVKPETGGQERFVELTDIPVIATNVASIRTPSTGRVKLVRDAASNNWYTVSKDAAGNRQVSLLTGSSTMTGAQIATLLDESSRYFYRPHNFNSISLTTPLSFSDGGLGFDLAAAQAAGVSQGLFYMFNYTPEVIGPGSAGQVLTSGGLGSRAYWATAAAGGTDLSDATPDTVATWIAINDSNRIWLYDEDNNPTAYLKGMSSSEGTPGLFSDPTTSHRVGLMSGTDGSGVKVDDRGGTEVIQYTAGERLYRVRTSTTNSDPIEDYWQKRSATTTNAATSVFYLSLDSSYSNSSDYTADGSTYLIRFDVICSRTDANGYAKYSREILYRNNAGTVTEIQEDVIGTDAESNANTACTFAVNGDAAEVTWTGDTAQNWTVHVHARLKVVNN